MNCYEKLGVNFSASKEDIEKAFKAKISSSDDLEENLGLHVAFNTLIDASRRHEHDVEIRQGKANNDVIVEERQVEKYDSIPENIHLHVPQNYQHNHTHTHNHYHHGHQPQSPTIMIGGYPPISSWVWTVSIGLSLVFMILLMVA